MLMKESLTKVLSVIKIVNRNPWKGIALRLKSNDPGYIVKTSNRVHVYTCITLMPQEIAPTSNDSDRI